VSDADQEIAFLDDALARDGSLVTLQRLTKAANAMIPFSVDAMAFIRAFRPTELTQVVIQGDVRVIMSPTEITKAGWPGAVPAPGIADKRVPLKLDRLVTKDGTLTIQGANGTFINSNLVRIDIWARG
jgi:hypothetical protein